MNINGKRLYVESKTYNDHGIEVWVSVVDPATGTRKRREYNNITPASVMRLNKLTTSYKVEHHVNSFTTCGTTVTFTTK